MPLPRIFPLLTLPGLLALLLLAGPGAALAQIGCGDSLGPGGTFKLSQNVGPCDTIAAALTVTGPATLDLNNKAVICGGATDGIVLLGSGVRVLNGRVGECGQHGLLAQGTGNHRIEKVVATGNGFDGFKADTGSNGNRFTSNTSRVNFHGFAILSNGNRLEKNSAVACVEDGFHVEGSENRFKKNVATGNTEDGFGVSGNENEFEGDSAVGNSVGMQVSSSENDVSDFSATGSRYEGLRVSGELNVVYHSSATGNAGHGFIIEGQENLLSECSATDNFTGFVLTCNGTGENELVDNDSSKNRAHGFVLENLCHDNTIEDNVARENGNVGILVASQDNEITGNEARKNGLGDPLNPAIDIHDTSPDCDNNTYSDNDFDTANQPCIE